MGSTKDNFKKFWSQPNKDFRNEIGLKITRIDSRLKFITQEINAVQDDFFHVYNYLYGTDVRQLTDRKPWEKTPADVFWERTTERNKQQEEEEGETEGEQNRK